MKSYYYLPSTTEKKLKGKIEWYPSILIRNRRIYYGIIKYYFQLVNLKYPLKTSYKTLKYPSFLKRKIKGKIWRTV